MFEDPCLTPNYVDKAAIRRYNFFKGFVLVGLIALLLMLWSFLGNFQNPTISQPDGPREPGVVAFAGTGQPGSTVNLLLNGRSIGDTIVDTDGNWSYESNIEAGAYELTVASLDADGFERGDVATQNFNVELMLDDGEGEIVYEAPTLILPTGNLDPNALILTGTGTPGSTVELFQNGVSVGTAVVGDDGTFSFTIPANGVQNEFEVVGFAPDGSEIGRSEIGLLTAVPPFATPNISTISLGDLTLGDDGLPTGPLSISGIGEPGQQIALSLDGNPLGTTIVDADGNWSFEDDVALPEGMYDLSASQTVSGVTETVTGNLTIPALGFVALDNASTDDFARLSLDGTATPGSEVEIIVNGEVVDIVTVDADGNWSWLSPGQFAADDYEIAARQVGDGTIVSDALMVSIAPYLTVDDINVGELSGDGAEVVVNGRSTPNSDVQIIIDGELVETVTADADGNWSYSTILPSGSYTIVSRVLLNGEGATTEVSSRATIGDVTGGLQLLYGGSTAVDDDPEGAITATLAGLPAVEVILDASWSMTMQFVDITRFQGARRALDTIVNDTLPEGTPFALRIFGNIEGNFACRTDLMVPYAPLDRSTVNQIVQDANPQFNANTPIAESLRLVADDLANADEEERIVVLLTDGEETCDGDPAAAIQTLVDQGFNVQVNIVGLSIADQALRDEFERWAELGGGTYYDVDNPGQLNLTLREATGAFFTVRDANGDPVATGRVGGRPLDLPPGTYSVEIRTSPNTFIEEVEVDDGEVTRIVLR